jgi:hypothetical protein
LVPSFVAARTEEKRRAFLIPFRDLAQRGERESGARA